MDRNEQRQTFKDLSATMEWIRSIDTSDWNAPYAVTLNFWEDTQKKYAIKDITHFLNRLDSSVFKGAYKKHGKRLRRIGVFEIGGMNGVDRPHYHMILESPKHLSKIQFEETVESLWKSSRYGKTYKFLSTGQRVPIFKMKKMHSNGWTEYIGKLKTKESADDADVTNWYLHPTIS
jgi:hypothetical protein